MNPSLWLAFLALEVGLSLTPGPAVLTVASQAVRHGWRRAIAGALGIGAANLLFSFLTETPILIGYGLAAEHGGRFLPEGRRGQWQDRIAGACLLAAVVWLGLRG